MGKEYMRSVQSNKDFENSYLIAKTILKNSKFKIIKDNKFSNKFELKAKERMKWLSTNWPVTIIIKNHFMDENMYFDIYAKCGGVSFTQDANTQEILNNICENIKTYCN